MSTPKLWSWFLSPFAGKVRVAFAEKGVPVELVEIDPRKRPPRLRELNPTARVPVLELDGVGIFESTAICEWLDEAHPQPPLWPSDPRERAAARGRLRWVDDELTRNFFLSLRKEAFGLDPTDHPDIVTTMRSQLVRRWADAERLLGRAGGDWMMRGSSRRSLTWRRFRSRSDCPNGSRSSSPTPLPIRSPPPGSAVCASGRRPPRSAPAASRPTPEARRLRLAAPWRGSAPGREGSPRQGVL